MNKRGCRGIWEELDVGEREMGLKFTEQSNRVTHSYKMPTRGSLVFEYKGTT